MPENTTTFGLTIHYVMRLSINKKLDNHVRLWYNIGVNKIMVTGGQYPRRVEARKRFACRPYVR